ncbi:MAG TPA: hypothetical protein VK631_19845 [Solirubrobacteraceae bacterium]|nr:hypothetical protein [Solirubrobacteraceae bacterium]
MPDVEMAATVRITVNDREPIERVTGPNGDEWRAHMYDLRTEEDVFEHWARNALANGVVDVCQLDGWADVSAETVTLAVWDVERIT